MSRKNNINNKSTGMRGPNASLQRNQSNSAGSRKKTKNTTGNSGIGAMNYAPVSKSRNIKTARPMMSSSKNGDCLITHREYITDLFADTSAPLGGGSGSAFKLQQFAINPGQTDVFPWLSKIAKNFETYQFDKLNFLYETEAPSSLAGTVLLAVDYDASDSPPGNKQTMLAYRGSVRSAPWNECVHHSLGEDLRKQKSYYVRPGANQPNSDIKLSDVGNLFVASKSVSTLGAELGELWVEYSIRLKTPQYIFDSVAGGQIVGDEFTDPNKYFGVDPIIDLQAIGMELQTQEDGSQSLALSNPGTYLMDLYTTGVGLLSPVVTALSEGLTIENISDVINTGNSIMSQTFRITSLLANAALKFENGSGTFATKLLQLASAPKLSLTDAPLLILAARNARKQQSQSLRPVGRYH